MKITVTDIIAMFPIAPANMPTIGTYQQPPTRHSIKTFKDKLYSQAIAIPTQEGDTTLGRIYQVLTEAQYIEIPDTNKAFPVPENPGSTIAPPMKINLKKKLILTMQTRNPSSQKLQYQLQNHQQQHMLKQHANTKCKSMFTTFIKIQKIS